MSKLIEGGCACGEIRYKTNSKIITHFKCHCRDCQRATGGPFVAAILVLKNHFEFVKGTPTYYTVPSTRGGTNTRSFCAKCGSRLTGGVREEGPFMGIVVSSLDEPALYKNEMHFFVSQAQPWDLINDGLPAYDQYPPSPVAVK